MINTIYKKMIELNNFIFIKFKYANKDFLFCTDLISESDFVIDFMKTSTEIIEREDENNINSNFLNEHKYWKIISCDIDLNLYKNIIDEFNNKKEKFELWDNQFGTRCIIDTNITVLQHNLHQNNYTIVIMDSKTIIYIRDKNSKLDKEHIIHILREPIKIESIKEGYLDVHGAACIYNDYSLLLVGNKNAGKSTLLMHLIEEGAIYIGNDSVRLYFDDCDKCNLLAWPHYIRLTYNTIQGNNSLKEYYSSNDYMLGMDDKYLLSPIDIPLIFKKGLFNSKSGLNIIIFPQIDIGGDNIFISQINSDEIKIRLNNIITNNRRINLIDDSIYDCYENKLKETINKLYNNLPIGLMLRYGTNCKNISIEIIKYINTIIN